MHGKDLKKDLKTTQKYITGLFFLGSLDVDYKERVIRYLVENDLSTGQDVDWKAMARLPQFKGKLTLRGSKN